MSTRKNGYARRRITWASLAFCIPFIASCGQSDVPTIDDENATGPSFAAGNATQYASSISSEKYISGAAVADLYAGHVICQGYNAFETSCSATEKLARRTANQIVIAHENYRKVRAGQDDSFGALFTGNLTKGSAINPEGVSIIDYQTFDLTPDGFCKSKDSYVQDARKGEYRWITEFGVGRKFVDMDPVDVEAKRSEEALNRSSQIVSNLCFKYVLESKDTIIEHAFIDDIRQSGSGTPIHLTTNNENLTIRPE